jgi:transposase
MPATVETRRRWTSSEKLAVVKQTLEPGNTVSMVARERGINPSQLFQWKRLYQEGVLSDASSAHGLVVPASEMAAAMKKIHQLERMLGKKTLENEILKEVVEQVQAKLRSDSATAVDGEA